MNNPSRQYVKANDFVMALKEMESFIDISVDDLMLLHEKTEKYTQTRDEENVTAKKKVPDYVMALQEMDTIIDVTIEDLMLLDQKAEKYARMRDKGSVLIEDLMTHPVKTIQSNCSLSAAAHLLVSLNISGLPVVNDSDKIIGIITEADFLRALGVPSPQPSHGVWQTLENMFASPPQMLEPDGLVSELMNKNVITLTPKQSIHQVISIMKKNQIKRIVISDGAQHVVGIITRSDIVRMFFDHFKPANDLPNTYPA